MNFWDLLQWPAMVVTVTAAWLVASSQVKLRNYGFWVFLLSNVLWIAWSRPVKSVGVDSDANCAFCDECARGRKNRWRT